MTTHSTSKALAWSSTTLAATAIGSPFAAPFAMPSIISSTLVEVHSHKKATISIVTNKRKVVAPNTRATSSNLCSTYTLIDIVDVGKL